MRRKLKSFPPVIARRQALPLWLSVLAVMATLAARAEEAPSPLTTAAAVRMLPPAEAAKERPVQLSGTLLLVTRQREALVLRDGTDGIYVELNRGIGNNRRPGDRLEVSGVTSAGDFAPMVRALRINWIGTGPLPPPRPTTIAELNAGGFDAAWVELEGIVRACKPSPPDQPAVSRAAGTTPTNRTGTERPEAENWTLTIAQGDDRMMVQVHDRPVPGKLIDARVRLRGVVFNVHNANRQFVRASVEIAHQGMITVITPPPPDPFALPLQRIEEIMRFTPTGFSGHRIRVRGVVTAHRQGRTLWLQEGDRGLRVASDQEGALVPGDTVEVVGFADHGGYAPNLSDAIFRKVAAGSPPVPLVLHAVGEISRQDSNLVQIEARLNEVRQTADGVLLALSWNDTGVTALLPRRAGEPTDLPWEPGSWVRATGICVSGQSEFSRPSGLWVADQMQMLLRSPGDLAVIRAAPWLTTQRALRIAVAVAAVILLTLIVVAVFARRQIAQREEARKLAEVEFSAMLAERNRLARELHDTIAQELNAVSMQMELAKNSARTGTVEDVMPHLVTAHGIVRGCIGETRESIWAMRSHILEKTDLLGALRSVAEQMSAGLGCTIRAQAQGRPRRLAPMIENNLLRIGQEAVSNALKHAQARVIDLEISFEASRVRLVVRDDGRGFDPAAQRADGHFGLQGMKERVEQMHGGLEIRRGENGGTCVEVVVNVLDS
jgi:signal transduction histidine kinase